MTTDPEPLIRVKAYLAHLAELGECDSEDNDDGRGWSIEGFGDHELRQNDLADVVAIVERLIEYREECEATQERHRDALDRVLTGVGA